VLFVNVDAAAEPERSCRVRMVPSMLPPAPAGSADREAGVTAVVILRDAAPSHVLSCVRAAVRDGASISPDLLHQLAPEARNGAAERGSPVLSDREYDVLRMLAEGESTRGIAERLCYSERTVKNIVHDLLVKLNCKTRAHAVALAVQQGVI
jgi:DNA-binding NarL/FixJ family response regulator